MKTFSLRADVTTGPTASHWTDAVSLFSLFVVLKVAHVVLSFDESGDVLQFGSDVCGNSGNDAPYLPV